MVRSWKKGDRVRVVYYQFAEAIGCVGTVACHPSSEANPVLRVLIDKADAERIWPGIVEWIVDGTANEHFELLED